MECRLREINTDIIVDDPETIKKLEKEINHKIESEIKQIIKYSQDVNSDIFNFGERFRARVRNVIVDKEKWYELYPQMKVNVKVESQIVRDGVFQ